MNSRKLFTAIGAGFTTFLLVAVLVIELLNVEFSAIVGLPIGLVVGIAVGIGIHTSLDQCSLGVRRAITAYAGFGTAVLVVLAASYVNLVSGLSLELVTGVGLGIAALIYLTLWLLNRTSTATSADP